MFEKILIVTVFALMSAQVGMWCYRVWFEVDFTRRAGLWRRNDNRTLYPPPGLERFIRDHAMRYFEIYRVLLLAGTILMILATVFVFILAFGI